MSRTVREEFVLLSSKSRGVDGNVLFSDASANRVLQLDRETWLKMGRPVVITVTVRPGDLRNGAWQ